MIDDISICTNLQETLFPKTVPTLSPEVEQVATSSDA